MKIKSMVFVLALFCVGFIATSSAEAQLFRRFQSAPQYYSPQRQYRPVSTPRAVSSPRPATGYGSNLHRNFTIRQEQLRSARTGLPSRYRGNIYWSR